MSNDQLKTTAPDIALLLWDDHQAARALGMTLKRVQQLARMGILPCFKIGREWRFEQESLQAWVKSQLELKGKEALGGQSNG